MDKPLDENCPPSMSYLESNQHPLLDPRLMKHVVNSVAAIFPDEFSLTTTLLPHIAQAEAVPVQHFRRLTPLSYDRNVFHLELDVRNTERIKDYHMGHALAIYPQNSPESVDEFIRSVLLSHNLKGLETTESVKNRLVTLPSSLVSIDSSEKDNTDGHTKSLFSETTSHSALLCRSTVERVLSTVLDVNGCPSKEFFQQLSTYALDILEKVRLAELTLDRLQAEFTEIVVEAGLTYTSVLRAFPSARLTFDQMMEIIPPMKPRLYSIASSSLFCPGQLDLLVIEETWMTKPIDNQKLNPYYNVGIEDIGTAQDKFQIGKSIHDGTASSTLPPSLRAGLCSHFLSTLKPGDTVTAALTESTMYLPLSHLSPIVMAGLGTGMAPFRAFLQEKLYYRRLGVEVGSLALYFGSRHKAMEYLYGDELEEMVAEGVLTRLNCAFSRDQPHKIYIQHRIEEDGKWLAEVLLQDDGYFYLCGPTWPVEDVKGALVTAFMKYGGVATREEAEEILMKMKEASRYILEVY